MGGSRSWVVLFFVAVAASAGCKDEKASTTSNVTPSGGSGTATATAPALPADIRVELGSCEPADLTKPWVSGPNPYAAEPALVGDLTGGFGISGTGSGSGPGGPGIGTGAGTGGGYGIGAPSGGRRMMVPLVTLGQPTVTGDLDKAIIRRYLKRNFAKLQYCYEKQLLVKPKLAGTVTASFTIRADGIVSDAKAAGVDKDVSKCIANVVAAIEFPKPKGGGIVKATYPITFRSPGDDAARPAPAAPTTGWQLADVKPQAPKPSDDDPPPPEDEDPSGGTGTAMALDEGKMGTGSSARQQAIDQARKAGILGSSALAAGKVPSLLQGQEAQLRDCIRKQSKPYGVALIHLGARGGAVEVHGIDDKAARECIAEIGKSLQKEPREVAMQCPLAFGALPLASARTVEIADKSVKYDGKDLGAQDPNGTGKIEALFEPAFAHVEAANKSGHMVPIVGPVVVRVNDSAPMGVVHRVLTTLKMAGDHAVIARDASTLVDADIALPAVPTTGRGSWGDPRTVEADSPQLVVLVGEDKIWVALSRINEIEALAVNDATALDATFVRHKKSKFFADRRDVQLAGVPSLPYAKLRVVYDALVKAGFRDIELADPMGLAVALPP